MYLANGGVHDVFVGGGGGVMWSGDTVMPLSEFVTDRAETK